MSGREGWLTRAVGAGVKDKEFIKNNISSRHEGKRNEHGEQGLVYFFERFALDPLAEPKDGKNAKRGKCRNQNNVSDFGPLHRLIITW